MIVPTATVCTPIILETYYGLQSTAFITCFFSLPAWLRRTAVRRRFTQIALHPLRLIVERLVWRITDTIERARRVSIQSCKECIEVGLRWANGSQAQAGNALRPDINN
jgi:hypothetical protein